MDTAGYCYATAPGIADAAHLVPWFGPVKPNGFADCGAPDARPLAGQTVVCIASGPSLTEADCGAVQGSGLFTIAVNQSWRRAPFAHVVYAADLGWWQQYSHEITVPAERWTCNASAAIEFGIHFLGAHTRAGNSGARAIELATAMGAAQVLLIGYDCTVARGTHWHGDHPRTTNPKSTDCELWATQFATVAGIAQGLGVDVINCSRDTALTCFARQSLADALSETPSNHHDPNS